MKTNLSHFLNTVGDAIIEQAEHIDEAAGPEYEREVLALRDYASQLWAVGDAADGAEHIDWSQLVDRIGVDLIDDDTADDAADHPKLLSDDLITIV